MKACKRRDYLRHREAYIARSKRTYKRRMEYDLTDFVAHKRDSLNRWRADGREDREKRRAQSRAFYARHKVRLRASHNAKAAVQRALKRGIIIRPSACSQCGASNHRIEAHHYLGYATEHYVDIIWLCHPCHAKTWRTI